ncbi:MAG: hypothetical protein ABSF29_15535 [Tepidisphaeraceae bacterium]|jgi:hypothetical protein
MDLKTFISESLKEIISGVRSAQDHFAHNPNGAKINPRVRLPQQFNPGHPVHNVEFDIAVTVSESSDEKVAAGLVVLGLGAGGQTISKTESSYVSRVKFSVPVIWPYRETAGGKPRPQHPPDAEIVSA